MKKSLPILDTNILVRFLVEDVVTQVKLIEELFKDADKDSLVIPDLVFAETVWVLQSFYKKEKIEVIEKMKILAEYEKFKLNRKLIKETLDIYSRENISFVDAYLCALVLVKENEFIYSFDQRLKKIAGVKIKEPGL